MNHRMACKSCGGEVDSDGIALVMLDEEEAPSEENELPDEAAHEDESTEDGPRGRAFAHAMSSRKSAPKASVVVEAHPEEEKPKKKAGSSDFRSFIKGK